MMHMLYIYIYIYEYHIYIYVCVYIYVCIYIYIYHKMSSFYSTTPLVHCLAALSVNFMEKYLFSNWKAMFASSTNFSLYTCFLNVVTIKQKVAGLWVIDKCRHVLTLHNIEHDLSLTALVVGTSKISWKSLSTSNTKSFREGFNDEIN